MPDLGAVPTFVFDAPAAPVVAIAPPKSPDLIFVPQTGPAGRDGAAALPALIDLGGPNDTTGA